MPLAGYSCKKGAQSGQVHRSAGAGRELLLAERLLTSDSPASGPLTRGRIGAGGVPGVGVADSGPALPVPSEQRNRASK